MYRLASVVVFRQPQEARQRGEESGILLARTRSRVTCGHTAACRRSRLQVNSVRFAGCAHQLGVDNSLNSVITNRIAALNVGITSGAYCINTGMLILAREVKARTRLASTVDLGGA